MSIWAYNRILHLVLLLLLLSLYLITWLLVAGFADWKTYSGLYSPLLVLVLVLLLYLRGLEALRRLFPWFHYGTLVGELVAHLVMVVLLTLNLATALHGGYVFGSTAAEVVISLFRLLLHATYVLLLIACVPSFDQLFQQSGPEMS